jgi:hypothetical protein
MLVMVAVIRSEGWHAWLVATPEEERLTSQRLPGHDNPRRIPDRDPISIAESPVFVDVEVGIFGRIF